MGNKYFGTDGIRGTVNQGNITGEKFFKFGLASGTYFKNQKKSNSKFSATIDAIKDIALKIIKENPNIPSEASFAIKNIHSSAFLINFVCSNMNITVKDKQNLLSSVSIEDRALKCLKFLSLVWM